MVSERSLEQYLHHFLMTTTCPAHSIAFFGDFPDPYHAPQCHVSLYSIPTSQNHSSRIVVRMNAAHWYRRWLKVVQEISHTIYISIVL